MALKFHTLWNSYSDRSASLCGVEGISLVSGPLLGSFVDSVNTGTNRYDWVVYMVRCSDGSLYTGIAKDVDRRVAEHNFDNQLAARYTRARRPVSLAYQEMCDSRSWAAKREAQIKRLNKKEKELLTQSFREAQRNG